MKTVTVNGSTYTHRGPAPFTVERFKTGLCIVLNADGINYLEIAAAPGCKLLHAIEHAQAVADALNKL